MTEQEKNEYRLHVSLTMNDALSKLGEGKMTIEETMALIDEYDAKSIDSRQHDLFEALRELALKVHRAYLRGQVRVTFER